MAKKIKTTEEHLQTIEFLLAGIILKRDMNARKIAKIIGCSDSKLTELFPIGKGKGTSKKK